MPLEVLRREARDEFWNLMYYFNEHQLPYDFMLPYENDDQARELHNMLKEQGFSSKENRVSQVEF